MPTEILLVVEKRRALEKRNNANLWAYLFLIPLVVCLCSIVLSFESSAFEGAMSVELGE